MDYSQHKYMDDLMKTDAEQPSGSGAAVVLGAMHERFVHKLVPGGWHLETSTFKNLKPKPAQVPTIKSPHFTAQMLSDAFQQKWNSLRDEGQDLAITQGYYQPWSRTQAGYDAFLNSKDFTIILQITNHQLNAEAIQTLLQRLPKGRPVCVLFPVPPHPEALALKFRYQSWTMLRSMKGISGQHEIQEEFKRGVVSFEELPELVKDVEQWCVPFPVIQNWKVRGHPGQAASPLNSQNCW